MFFLALVAAALAGPNPGIVSIAHIEPFELETPVPYPWNASQESIVDGTLLVIHIESERARIRQVGGPVLYVGNTPAARLNPGHLDAHIIAYVPGHVDLSVAPVFWGPSTLPEAVRPSIEGEAAVRNGQAKPFAVSEINPVLQPQRTFKNEKHIQVRAADLIEKYAPQDMDFARGYRTGWNP